MKRNYRFELTDNGVVIAMGYAGTHTVKCFFTKAEFALFVKAAKEIV